MTPQLNNRLRRLEQSMPDRQTITIRRRIITADGQEVDVIERGTAEVAA
jgi:hypothetical protein